MWNPALLDPSTLPAEVAAHWLLGPDSEDPLLRRCRVAVARAALEVSAPPGPVGEPARAEGLQLAGYLDTLLNSGITVRVDVRSRNAGTESAIAAVLLSQVFTLELGPIPSKRHRWPAAIRDEAKRRATGIASGFAPTAQLVKESTAIPGAWPVRSKPATGEKFSHVRVLPGAPRQRQAGYLWQTDWPSKLKKDSLPYVMVPLQAGSWERWLWWRVGEYLVPQELPAVLQRCELTAVTVTRSGIRTSWQPQGEIWRRNESE